MRRFLIVVICFFLAACNKHDDHFYPLSESEKDVLKYAYSVGDTVLYYYSDKQVTDTFHYLVEAPRAYLEWFHPMETNVVEHYEQYQQTLRNLDGGKPIVLTIGTGWINNGDGYPFNKFYIEAGGFYEENLQPFVNNLRDSATFHFGSAHNPYNYDMTMVHYSRYLGMMELSDTAQNIFLKRLP